MKHEKALQRGWRAATFALATAAAGCGVLQAPVVRQVNGVQTEGRFIEPEAYASYAVAALHEARGQWADALRLYQRAFDIDSHGPELRTRIGSVACKLHQDKLADRSFAAAMRADAEYGPLWFELALCKRARGDLDAAQSAALEAVRLDPERFEASFVAADLAEQGGDAALAWQLRDGLATHAPDSTDVQRRVLAAANKDRDRPRAERAEAALAALSLRRGAPTTESPVTLALAALRRGDITHALAEAQLLLDADPGNGDALVIALTAADLEQDHAVFNALLERSTEASSTPASPEVLSTLASLLGRRVSAQAAQLVTPQP